MNVIQYCVEEVHRQGFHIEDPDGIARVGWMLCAWYHACNERGRAITVDFIRDLGMMIEPVKNRNGFRDCRVGVRGSGKAFPDPNRVELLLVEWIEDLPDRTPLEAYRVFEEIHPFRDGNGRTGKILLNALNATLVGEPIFPPHDFWGGWSRNP